MCPSAAGRLPTRNRVRRRPGRRGATIRRAGAPSTSTSSTSKGPAKACRSICRASRTILDAIDIECELGGGIRDEQSVIELLEFGLSRLVIGTSAITDPEGFRQMCRKYPGKLVLGIDARDGRVATDGWLQTSDVGAIDLARQFADEPLAAIIYTDIATDGMLRGPNVTAMAEMQEAVDVPVIASGGVTTADDVAQLAAAGLAGCIIGRALYVGTLEAWRTRCRCAQLNVQKCET